MDHLVSSAQGFNPELRAWVVISRASTNPAVREASETSDLLADFEHLTLAQAIICDRIAYRKAARDGRCTAEMRPTDTKAVAEMHALYAEVFNEQAQK